jgi:Transposase
MKQAETGTPVAKVTRPIGIWEQTFYRWKKLYGGLGVGELRRLKRPRRHTSAVQRERQPVATANNDLWAVAWL